MPDSPRNTPSCRLRFAVTGMSCAACQARVEKVVSKVDGVDSVAVNLLKNSMEVTSHCASPEEKDALTNLIEAAVSEAGYGAERTDGRKASPEKERASRSAEAEAEAAPSALASPGRSSPSFFSCM